ncbi:MAG: uridine kinase, partial [Chloroflexota bacterium]
MRYAEFLRLLAGRPRRQSTMIFALDGHGGSGKSHFAARLVRCAEQDSPVQPVTLVHMDDFYLPGRLRTPRRGREKPVGGDYDLARLRDTVLRPLAEDQPGAYRRYDWPTDRLAEAHTVPVGGLG